VQVLALCREAGMAKLGHVALDGTKVKANASKHAAMSYARMKKEEPELAKLVAAGEAGGGVDGGGEIDGRGGGRRTRPGESWRRTAGAHSREAEEAPEDAGGHVQAGVRSRDRGRSVGQRA
jgi:hypothetical protein